MEGTAEALKKLSEKYTVIVADQTFDQQGLDWVSGNTSRGVLFCARRAI